MCRTALFELRKITLGRMRARRSLSGHPVRRAAW